MSLEDRSMLGNTGKQEGGRNYARDLPVPREFVERQRENLKVKQSRVVGLERILANAHKACICGTTSFSFGGTVNSCMCACYTMGHRLDCIQVYCLLHSLSLSGTGFSVSSNSHQSHRHSCSLEGDKVRDFWRCFNLIRAYRAVTISPTAWDTGAGCLHWSLFQTLVSPRFFHRFLKTSPTPSLTLSKPH